MTHDLGCFVYKNELKKKNYCKYLSNLYIFFFLSIVKLQAITSKCCNTSKRIFQEFIMYYFIMEKFGNQTSLDSCQ